MSHHDHDDDPVLDGPAGMTFVRLNPRAGRHAPETTGHHSDSDAPPADAARDSTTRIPGAPVRPEDILRATPSDDAPVGPAPRVWDAGRPNGLILEAVGEVDGPDAAEHAAQPTHSLAYVRTDADGTLQPVRRSASPAQIAANRANATKSTGPKRAWGKRRAARNALKHGLSAVAVLTPGESAAELQEFRRDMLHALEPEGAVEAALAERVVAAAWRFRRALRLEADLFREECDRLAQHTPGALAARAPRQVGPADLPRRTEPPGAAHDADGDGALAPMEEAEPSYPPSGVGRAYQRLVNQGDPLERLARYEALLERSFYRALHELARVQAGRRTADIVLPRAIDVLVHA